MITKPKPLLMACGQNLGGRGQVDNCLGVMCYQQSLINEDRPGLLQSVKFRADFLFLLAVRSGCAISLVLLPVSTAGGTGFRMRLRKNCGNRPLETRVKGDAMAHGMGRGWAVCGTESKSIESSSVWCVWC